MRESEVRLSFFSNLKEKNKLFTLPSLILELSNSMNSVATSINHHFRPPRPPPYQSFENSMGGILIKATATTLPDHRGVSLLPLGRPTSCSVAIFNWQIRQLCINLCKLPRAYLVPEVASGIAPIPSSRSASRPCRGNDS